ncbi:unnamed protein product [Callosobruchus maculatus]|uniref:Uncharacterized protein n=1 Tax=Callosobruchus maculatus TaxID=64391 RepID=A0A653BHA4_CALMS|nr:unnamed protein product [Callosobruchus maculatus]
MVKKMEITQQSIYSCSFCGKVSICCSCVLSSIFIMNSEVVTNYLYHFNYL